MKKLILILTIFVLLAPKANAIEFVPPEIPGAAADRMPQEPESFADGLWSIIQESIVLIEPALADAAKYRADLW